MKQIKELYKEILENGEERETRTGAVYSIWDSKIKFDLKQGFPAVTSKKLYWQGVVGELLWFLSGSYNISDLKHYTYGDKNSSKWTIWTDDCERWHKQMNSSGSSGHVGNLYPHQWRSFGHIEDSCDIYNLGVDQIENLIHRLKNEPQRRDHIVMAWNAYDIENNKMALKPCHLGFQCYVDSRNKLHLKWWQRSVDSFLGLPYNIASYALLTHLLAVWTGLDVGSVTGDLGDVHIYQNHVDAVNQYINNPEHELPVLILPEGTETLSSTLCLDALDFQNSLFGYKNSGSIPAPLSVGN